MKMPPRRELDWEALYERLERAKAAAERWMTPDPDRARTILDDRARTLAMRTAVVETSTEETAELMYFAAGDESFAVGLSWVSAVARIDAVERVPDAPAVFRGVTNHRGKVLAVIDLGALLTGARTEHATGSLLILGKHRAELGIAVDAVDTVVRIHLSRIDRTSMLAWQDRAPFASGLIDGRRLVLDGQRLLDDPRLTASTA